MSLIHLEKSVLSFHLKEILEDGHGNHPLTWLALGIVLVAPKLTPSVLKSHRLTENSSQNQGLTQRSIPLSEWIAQAQERERELQTHR